METCGFNLDSGEDGDEEGTGELLDLRLGGDRLGGEDDGDETTSINHLENFLPTSDVPCANFWPTSDVPLVSFLPTLLLANFLPISEVLFASFLPTSDVLFAIFLPTQLPFDNVFSTAVVAALLPW